MRVRLNAPPGQWLKATNEKEKAIAKAATAAMRDVGLEARNKGRTAIASAGFSSRWQSSLVVKNYPKSGDSLSPAEYIHTTINYADVFEKGAKIAGSPFLWLPLPNVPPDPAWHRPHMTPGRYVKLVGPLVTMRPRGASGSFFPMLGAVVRLAKGESLTRRALSRGLLGRGRTAIVKGRKQVIPLFFAVTQISLQTKFDVTAAAQQAIGNFEQYFEKHAKEANMEADV